MQLLMKCLVLRNLLFWQSNRLLCKYLPRLFFCNKVEKISEEAIKVELLINDAIIDRVIALG